MHIYKNEEIDSDTNEYNVFFDQNPSFILYDIEPKPIDKHANVSYELKKNGIVKISIYDSKNKEVDNIIDGHQTEGFYKIRYNSSRLKTGFYRIKMNLNEECTEVMFVIN